MFTGCSPRWIQNVQTQPHVTLKQVWAYIAKYPYFSRLRFVPGRADDPSLITPVLIPGAPAGLAGFTPNQQVEILGEMDSFGDASSATYQPVLIPVADGDAIYNICSVDLSRGAKWLSDDAGIAGVQFDVRIEDFFDTDRDGTVGPSPGITTIDASDIVIYGSGTGPNPGSSDLDAVASLGGNNTVNANIFAKNGIPDIGQGTAAIGAFLAKDVFVAANTVLTHGVGTPLRLARCHKHEVRVHGSKLMIVDGHCSASR